MKIRDLMNNIIKGRTEVLERQRLSRKRAEHAHKTFDKEFSVAQSQIDAIKRKIDDYSK